jgi:hypothetical protein
VLAVDDVPISAVEVDRVASWVGALYPEDTASGRRRKALTAVVLRRAATEAQHGSAYEAARLALRADRAALTGAGTTAGREGGAPPAPESRSGTWHQLGLDLWGPARELEVGAWSEPLDGAGIVRLVRLDERIPGTSAADLRLRVSVVERSYLPGGPGDAREAAIERSRLVVVDPAWEELVPLEWRHRMAGGSRSE